MKKRRLAVMLGCVLTLFFSAFATIAQQDLRTNPHPIKIELHGNVRYSDLRRPAANILVRLENFNGGIAAQMLTDRDGRFRFSGLASRQYTLTIRAAGYRDAYQTVDLLTATSDFVNVDLVPESRTGPKPRKSIAYIDANVPAGARKEFEKGEDSLAAKKYADAIRHFENAVQLHPSFFEAELSLGTAYMDQGQLDNAEMRLKRANELNTKSPNALFALGELYLLRNRLADAEQTLRAGLKMEPRAWKARFALARVYWKKPDLVSTAKQLALTLQLNPEHAEAHFLAGHVFAQANKLPEALLEFQEYLRLAPKGANAVQAREMIQKVEQRLSVSNK